MYLKALAQLSDTPAGRVHDLVELFDGLPQAAHDAVRTNLHKSTWVSDITELTDLRSILVNLRNAFVEWRYVHEIARSKVINIPHMIYAMEVLHETCKSALHGRSKDN